jgi:hypothetical protein
VDRSGAYASPVSARTRQQAQERISRLALESRDLVSFWQACTEALRRALPYYAGPCWYTLDPASLLITSHWNPVMPVLPPESLAAEYSRDDVNNLADVARSRSGISTLTAPPAATRARARAGTRTWPWAVTRS